MPVYPVGRSALLLEVSGSAAATAAYRRIRLLADRSGALTAPRDVVPAARTVLVDGIVDGQVDAWRAALSGIGAEVDAESTDERPGSAVPGRTGEATDIPVTYDGPDLPKLAECWGITVGAAVELLSGAVFTVAFCGFAPGFAYCTSDLDVPPVPRRETPRPRVPAGSLGIAGEYCGVYPQEMPGGWQLVGRTSEVMFDVRRTPPARLHPGDAVRFPPPR